MCNHKTVENNIFMHKMEVAIRKIVTKFEVTVLRVQSSLANTYKENVRKIQNIAPRISFGL